MIASISGALQSIRDHSLVVHVGGIGWEVLVPSSVLSRAGLIGHEINLFTHLVVREDALTLYGFSTEEECAIFKRLLTVSGIGPRLALNIMSTLTPEMLASSIQGDNPDVIARVPGIGKKTAQKIVLELKGKLLPETLAPGLAPVSTLDTEVIEALTALGYSIVEAQAALQSIPHDAPQDIEERVRLALQFFGG